MDRIKKVKELLAAHHLDGLIVDNPIDIFYLTGLELSLGRLVIQMDKATLFVDGRYIESCRKQTKIEAIETRGYGPTSPFAAAWNLQGKRVGFDADTTSYTVFLDLQSLQSELVELKSPIKHVREIKEASEIAALKKAAALGSKGYDYTLNLLQEGVTEEEIAIELELFWRKSGGEKLAFAPHIAFGANTSQPHYHSGKRELKKGDLVLIDIGVMCGHFCSDMTRVVFFGIPANSELEKIYFIVKEAQQRALASCRPGTLIGEVDQKARGWIEDKGYGRSFPHGLGHGVGLEIHELPVIRQQGIDANRPLVEGMVVTIEPGIYLPGIGGVRLEDTIAITSDGYENLTCRPIGPSLPII